MSGQFHAVCETHRAVNGRHYLSFTVEVPADHPSEFELQPSPLECERVKKHSVDPAEEDVGWVPVVYEEEWVVDWAALEGYTR